MTWRAHHRESERIASEADEMKRQGNEARARTLYARAAAEERNAIADLEPTKHRTFGITAVAIASLYFQGGLYDDAERAACDFIASERISDYGRHELRMLLTSIYALQEYEPVYAEESPGQINISLRGGAVERGGAPAQLISRTIKTFESFLYRTVEHLEDLPFRKGPRPQREIQAKYHPWIKQLAPASFRFAVGLHAPQQQSLMNSDDLVYPEAVSSALLAIVGTATEEATDQLAEIVPSERYRLKFLQLTRDLAPTRSSAFDRLSLRGAYERQPMTLSTDTRRTVNRNIRTTIDVTTGPRRRGDGDPRRASRSRSRARLAKSRGRRHHRDHPQSW